MNAKQEKLEADLLDLIEGKLSDQEAARVRGWLAADPQLSEQVAGMVLDREMVRRLPKAAPPSHLSEDVLARLERGSLLTGLDHEVHIRKYWRSRLAMAALFAVMIGGFGFVVVEGVMMHKGPWGDWAASGVANKKEPVLALKTDVGPLASAERKDMEGLSAAHSVAAPAIVATPAAAPLEPSKQLDKSTAKADQNEELAAGKLAPALPASPAVPVVAKPTGSAPGDGTIVASAGGGGLKGADRDQAGRMREVEPSKGVPAEKAAFKDASNALAALDSLNCTTAHFNASGPPLVLTLVAQSATEGDELQRTLAALSNEPASEIGQQTQLATNGTLANTGTVNTVGNTAVNAAGNTAVNTTGNITANAAANTLNNGGYAPQELGQVAANSASNTAPYDVLAQQRAPTVQQNKDAQNIPQQFRGEIVAQKEQDANGPLPITGNLRGQAQTQGQPSDYYARAGSAADAARHVAANDESRDDQGASYHARLTAQQIAALSAKFKVRTASRGAVVYFINGATGAQPSAYALAGAKASAPTPTAMPATHPVGAMAAASAAPAARPESLSMRRSKVAAGPAPETVPGGVVIVGPNQQLGTAQATSGYSGGGVGGASRGEADSRAGLIDCIITVVPADTGTQRAK